MRFNQSALAAVICLAAGCASSGPVRSLAVAQGNTAVVDHGFRGGVALRSERTHVVNVRPLKEKFSDATFTLPTFAVLVTNGGVENVELKPNDIAAFSGDRRLVVLNPTELQERLDREQGSRGSESSPSGVPRATPLDEPVHRPSGPSVVGPSQAWEPPADFKVPRWLVEDALRMQVIRPGEVGGGDVVIEAEHIAAGRPLKIVVTVAGEKHEFLFDVRG